MKRTAAILALLAAQWAIGQKPVRVTFVYSDGNVPTTIQAYKSILAERPDLRGRVAINFLTESVFDEAKPADLTSSDVLVLDTMNQQMLDRFDATHKTKVLETVKKRGKVITVGEGLLPKEHYIDLGVVWNDQARAYWQNSVPLNWAGS